MITDNEIIKALECCRQNGVLVMAKNEPCTICEEYIDGVTCNKDQCPVAKMKAENDDLFYKLQGVMWFVDKWLDGDELKQDEVNRAATMREKTLRITENLQAEVERLTDSNARLREAVRLMMNYDDGVERIKAEAIKEFVERLKNKMVAKHKNIDGFCVYECDDELIDNLAKEMTEEENE